MIKKCLIVLMIAGAAGAAESYAEYVFATNGVVVCRPRELPAVGVRLDTRQPVVGLHGAVDEVKAACGWFRVVKREVPEGMVAAGAWRIEGVSAWREAVAKPQKEQRVRVISKFKLVEELESLGLLSEFMAYLERDEVVKFKWDAAVTLDEDNALVVGAAAELKARFGLDDEAVEQLIDKAQFAEGSLSKK